MEIRVERDVPCRSEPRQLPAATYNRMRTLLRKASSVVFVPIRSMQFLAIVDTEEIVFVDHLRKNWAVVAWREFRPGQRSALDAAVPYQAVYYREDGAILMRRLQGEFDAALVALAAKVPAEDHPARILDFVPRRGGGTS